MQQLYQVPIVVYIQLYLLMIGLDTTETCTGLTKYTKNQLCIKLVFLYTIISRRTVNKT